MDAEIIDTFFHLFPVGVVIFGLPFDRSISFAKEKVVAISCVYRLSRSKLRSRDVVASRRELGNFINHYGYVQELEMATHGSQMCERARASGGSTPRLRGSVLIYSKR